MRITIKTIHDELAVASRSMVEEKLSAISKLLGTDDETALLEVEVERSPAQGRSSEPYRLSANLTIGGDVFHAEAVKPTAESAADKVRSELEAELRHARGKTRSFIKRGGAALKNMLRFEN